MQGIRATGESLADTAEGSQAQDIGSGADSSGSEVAGRVQSNDHVTSVDKIREVVTGCRISDYNHGFTRHTRYRFYLPGITPVFPGWSLEK